MIAIECMVLVTGMAVISYALSKLIKRKVKDD